MLAITERVFGLVAERRRNAVLESWSGPRLTHIRPRVEGIPGFEHGFNDYLVDEGYRATRDGLTFAARSGRTQGPEAAAG